MIGAVDGLRPEEIEMLNAIARTASRHEQVVIKLAVVMARDGEMSGARWLVRRVIARRRGEA